jgi:hypothetical protein
MAFRTIDIDLFVGIDKKFFKDMTALEAPEFKNGHSVSSPFKRFHVHCFQSVVGLWVPTFEPGTLNAEPLKYSDQTAQSQTHH